VSMPRDHLIGIFLDADGVLWPDNGPGEILNLNTLEESKARLCNFLRDLGDRESFFITVVTNQTLAARGEAPYLLFRKQVYRNLNSLRNLHLIDHFEVCFHHPNAQRYYLRRKKCKCRKPAPGMFLKSMRKFRLLGSNSLVIGDRITDISAANAAGISRHILLYDKKSLEVNGGYLGKSQISAFLPFNLCLNLAQAAEVIRGWHQND